MKKFTKSTLFLVLILCKISVAQNFSLLKDINQMQDAFPRNASAVNGTLVGNVSMELINGVAYFAATNGINGEELWRSDGTAAGTYMVRDINPGPGSSSITNIVSVNGVLFFSANDGINGAELWKSDGTTTGTVLVKDISTASSSPSNLTMLNNVLYFSASESNTGFELWRSDGSVLGTYLVKDINPGTASSSPQRITVMGSNLYFSASDGVNGVEPWKSDGTANGTVLLRNINAGNANSSPTGFTATSNNFLYFSAATTDTGLELYRTDGTTNGTILVKDINVGSASSNPLRFFAVGGNVFFVATDGVGGFELWISDGTVNGTKLVKDINVGAGSSTPDAFTLFNGSLYFRANDGVNGAELWKSDGTSNGTTLVKDIYTGPISAFPFFLAVINNQLYFQASDDLTSYELWKSDGTSNGTVLVKDIATAPQVGSGPALFTRLNNTSFLLRANDGVTGQEIWISNGTANGTTLLKDINTTLSGSNNFFSTGNSAINNNSILFIASDVINGSELWKTDGTGTGTVLVTDAVVGSNSHSPQSFLTIGNTTYYSGTSLNEGQELWKTDGTANGTVLVRDIAPGTLSSSPNNLINFNGTLIFTATIRDANNVLISNSVFRSDGTSNGTVKIFDTQNNAFPDNFFIVGNTLFFRSESTLWKTDGTTAGTSRVLANNVDLNPYSLASLNGVLYFTGFSTANGTELWRSDGTVLGTYLLKDINTSGSSSPSNLTTVGNNIYFSASDGVNGIELWKTDGTTNGTVLLKDLNPGLSASNPGGYGTYANYKSNIYNFSNTVLFPRFFSNDNTNFYFTAFNATSGVELYVSDGTANGTVVVRDVNEPSTSFSNFIFANDGRLFYNRNNKLWQSNGTSSGTNEVVETNFADATSLNNFLVLGNKLMINVAKPIFGTELWVSDVSSILPLTILTYTAQLQNNQVRNQWQTTNEVNVSHINVQRSVDGIHFSTIGKVNAKGGGDYNFWDMQLPSANRFYYRLEVVDNDGSKKYSKVITFNQSTNKNLTVVPNPVKTVLTAQITQDVQEKVLLQVTDVQGKVLYSQQTTLSAGTQNITINVQFLAAGNYILSVNGSEKTVTRFIKE